MLLTGVIPRAFLDCALAQIFAMPGSLRVRWGASLPGQRAPNFPDAPVDIVFLRA